MSETNVEVVKLKPPEVEAVRPVKYDFSEYLVAGEDLSLQPGFFPGRTQPTGKCDGVVYLLGRKDPKTDAQILPNLEKRARCYLRPQSAEWLSQHPGFIGMCHPELMTILAQPENRLIERAIVEHCEETGQGIGWVFTTCLRALEATRPENIGHWRVVPSPEKGVWCVIWV